MFGTKYLRSKRNEALHLKAMPCHSLQESHQELVPSEWYEKEFRKLSNLTNLLKNVDMIDGSLVDLRDDSLIIDQQIKQKMLTFKSLARVFLGSPKAQEELRNEVMVISARRNCNPFLPFSKSNEREPMVVSSLTTVSNFLNISAQQRKLIRATICPQVTQHHILTGTLEELFSGLQSQLAYLDHHIPSKRTKMAQQIVSSCSKFLSETVTSCDFDSTSWMRLAPAKMSNSSSHRWEDVLEMINDLIECLKTEEQLATNVAKLVAMKEGFSQIKDVLIDRSIGYKEVRHQEILVKKKLSKTLGHPSKCLFTLLLYYLYGYVRDMHVDICGGIYASEGQGRICLCMGRIVTSDEEKMIWSGVKQLERVLGLFKFVWEIAGLEGVLSLQGHIWCIGAKARTLQYRGNMFFVHGISV